MTVPALVPRCADAITTGNPNFSGAKVHVCPNSVDTPGSCVKLKGHMDGLFHLEKKLFKAFNFR